MHFFNIKPDADEARMFHLINHGLLGYTRAYGCLERKTWTLVDATAQAIPAATAAYVNEALWPSQKAADAFARDWMGDVPNEVKEFRSELDSGVETVLTVRYIDEAG